MSEIFLPAGEHQPIVVENTTALRIRGEGIGQTILRVDGEWGIEMRGKVGSLEVSDITIAMNGKGTGIGCNSGTEVDRLRARRVEVMNGATGISANADLSGYFRDVKIEDCHVHDMPGEEPGHGYGIHAANAELLTISGCLVERCGRHSIYQARTAKRTPGAIKIIGNTIRQHRPNPTQEAMRTAIVVSRSCGVIVAHNQIIDGRGGGLEISAVNTGEDRPWPCDSVDVYGNQFFGRKDSICYVLIGEQGMPVRYVPEDISVTGNRFDTVHEGVPTQPDIWVLNGRRITLTNTHRHRGNDGSTQRGITIGDPRFGKTVEHLSDVDTRGSRFFCDAANTARFVTVDGPARMPIAQVFSDLLPYTEQ